MNQSVPDLKVLWKNYQPVVISLSLLIGLYLLLRLPNLTLLPIFVDEAIYIRWAQVMRAEATLRFLPLSDGKQPLFMWVLMLILKVVADPLLAGRLLSVLTGLGSLLGMFFLTAQLTKSHKHALTAALLYAVVPYTLFFDRMALVDNMLMMWGIWGFYFALRHVEKPALDMSLLAGGCLGLAWLTKSPGMVLLGLVPFMLVVKMKNLWPIVMLNSFQHLRKLSDLRVKSAGSRIKFGTSSESSSGRQTISLRLTRSSVGQLSPQGWYVIKVVSGWVVIVLVAWAMYNVLRLGPEFHQIAARNKDYLYPWEEIMTHPWSVWKPNFLGFVSFAWGLLTPPVVGLAVWGWWVAREFKSGFRWWLLVWILLPSLLQVGLARSVTARYFLYTVPAWLLLAAIGLRWILLCWKWGGGKILIVLVTFAPALWINLLLLFKPLAAPLPRIERSGYLEEWTAGFGLREIAGYINQEANVQSIVVGTEGFFGTMPDGLQIYFDKHPRVTIVGQSYDVSSVSQQLYDSLDQNKVYLLVNKSRLNIYDTYAAGLRLIKEFPKAKRPDGSRESLLWFEVVDRPS